MIEIVGIDPGLVHTGVVKMQFSVARKAIEVTHTAVDGPDPAAVEAWIGTPTAVFIEGYRPRSNLSTDQRMVTAVSKFREELGGTVLLNTGVKKVVRQPLMELLHVWSFPTVTHHQDLRSAARIGLLGMLKDDHLNHLLTQVVTAHLDGNPWNVHY